MNSADLERRVASALHDLVDDPVTSPAMFERVADRVRRGRRRRAAGAASAVVVVAALATGGLLLRPASDPATGPAATASCPDKDPGAPRNSRGSDSDGALVAGTPVVATICRYYGLNQPALPGTLARSAMARDEAAAALASALNGGHRIPEGARYNCPADFGASIRIIFGYRRGAAVTVWVDPAGCRTATNGMTALFTSQAAQRQLTNLVGE
ncbi:hypothetical protein GCM10023322_33180 [Rugosimonospora acidiphila]|uniref:Uncharacterized protein n=1 Tax=Rugosimonospora acidiphila TaxID=556531 RepID=A0ABP9RTI2_9ACTN